MESQRKAIQSLLESTEALKKQLDAHPIDPKLVAQAEERDRQIDSSEAPQLVHNTNTFIECLKEAVLSGNVSLTKALGKKLSDNAKEIEEIKKKKGKQPSQPSGPSIR